MKHTIRKLVVKAGGLLGLRITPHHVHPEPPVASQMSVDYIHGIIDAAVQGNCTPMFALYRDVILQHGHIQTELNKRKLAVLGDDLSITPAEDTPEMRATVDRLKDAWKKAENLDLAAPAHLLDATLYPVSLCEKVFKPSSVPGIRFQLKELVPVNHELLDFSERRLLLKEVDDEGRPTGELYEPTPDRFIIHRGHLLSAPDNFGGPFRALLFWWLLSTQGRGWWARYLERYGSGFLVGKYDSDDDESRRILEAAFQYATTIGGLVVTRETEVDIQQAAAASNGQAFKEFTEVCNREISKIILGQTLSAEAQSTGLGSGVAKAHEAVRSDYRDFDSLMLAKSLKRHLFDQLAELNGLDPDHYKVFYGDVDTEEAEISGGLVRSLSEAGLQLTDGGIQRINQRTGLEFERVATADSPQQFSLAALAASSPRQPASDLIVSAGATYSRYRRARLAEAARIIRESATEEEAIATLSAELKIPHGSAVDLVANTLRSASLDALLPD